LPNYDEFPNGLFRNKIRHYDERLIRELLINAIAHKSYTISGDIFIKVYPDRLEIHNSRIITLRRYFQHILHQSVRRNAHLSKLFYDLNLMEREGSGYDKIYEIQLREAKRLPVVEEGSDRVEVTLFKEMKNPDIVRLINEFSSKLSLRQKEINQLRHYFSI